MKWTDYSKKKEDQLGMKLGTATMRLRKMIMFDLLKQHNKNYCFRCGEEITDISTLSIDHKQPWQNSEDPQYLYFDMNNIAFSHLKCNIMEKEDRLREKTKEKYKNEVHKSTRTSTCKCEECRSKKREYDLARNSKKGQVIVEP